jgi:hypothetical protein
MLFVVEVEVSMSLWPHAVDRYAVLQRVGRVFRSHAIGWYSFALHGTRLRLVADADGPRLSAAMNHVAGGTARAARSIGREGRLEHWRSPVADLEEALVDVLRAPGSLDPLCYPWTSYRDLMGLRYADFFDAAPVRGAINAERIRFACGGGELPRPSVRPEVAPPGLLVRLAAAFRGVVPADRACFPLFVHLGRACGVSTDKMARTLGLTPRRVNQILEKREPLLPVALGAAGDARMRVLP